jgi:DNA-binding IclR family transcriptional regulator
MARAAPAASRAASILAFLTAHRSRGFTISELVSHLGLNIASAHATLAVLCDVGFTVRDPIHRTYTLGPALAATGFAALEQHPAIGAAIAQAEVLAAELRAEVNVMAIAGRDVIFLAKRGPESVSGGTAYPGDRSPLLAPFGAVFMAWADEVTINAWLERASVEPAKAKSYLRILAETRARGFSVPMRALTGGPIQSAIVKMRDQPEDDEAEHELTAALHDASELLVPLAGLDPAEEVTFITVAAPIFDPIGRVLLSLSISGPDHPVPVAHVLKLGRRLTKSAAIATRQGRGRAPIG